MEMLPLELTLSSLHEAKATLVTASGHEFHWPSDALPPSCKPGDSFCIDYQKAHSLQLDDQARTRMGRALLNELLYAG